MTLGTFVNRSELERTTFGELLDRYAREETPKKRGYETELVRIRALMRHPWLPAPCPRYAAWISSSTETTG